MLDALAAFIARSTRRVLLVATAVVLMAGVYGAPVVGKLDSEDDFDDPAAEAIRARDALQAATGAGPAPAIIALVRLNGPVSAPAAQAKLKRVARVLGGQPGVAYVRAPRPGDRRTPMVSKDRQSAYLAAGFDAGADRSDVADALQAKLASESGVTLGGPVIAQQQVPAQVEEDLKRAEMLAFPILFVLSLFVFRSGVAALLPLAVGGSSILLTFAALRLINEIEPMSVFAINLITGAGLGLAIDYSLFMVSRFREELERGSGTPEALQATIRTAGRTVLFSALTVAAALASLIVFPQRFLFSMGVGGALVCVMAALTSVTLLPALLAALGPRVNALSPRRWRLAMHRDAAQIQAGFWYRMSRFVMRRAAIIAAGASIMLIAAGLPFLRIEFTGIDASVLPPDRSARVVSDALANEFPVGSGPPLYVAIRAPRDEEAQVRAYAIELAQLPGAVAVTPPMGPYDGLWRVDVIPRGGMLDEVSKELVADVREVPAPFAQVLVGGSTANFVDQLDSLGQHLKPGLVLICTTTLVILFLLTGSLILPLKTLLMNVLTVSAAFGLLVLIFQDGRLETVLDFKSQGALEASQPILLFAITFGLATDYGVFLLTRIKEARDAGASERESVAIGVERTGRIITAAAVLFCIAIGAFATSDIIFIKQVGIGTALGVIIDATLVRALLVPSLMALLGRWNWWAPRPLARLHAAVGLREGEPIRRPA